MPNYRFGLFSIFIIKGQRGSGDSKTKCEGPLWVLVVEFTSLDL